MAGGGVADFEEVLTAVVGRFVESGRAQNGEGFGDFEVAEFFAEGEEVGGFFCGAEGVLTPEVGGGEVAVAG